MPLVPIPGFCGSTYLLKSKGVSASRTVNMRVEKNQDPSGTVYSPIPVAKSAFTLYPRSGKKLFTTMPIGPNVGCYGSKYGVYVASGGNLYYLQQDGSKILVGPLTVGSNPVTMRSNNKSQTVICSGGTVTVYDGVNMWQPLLNYAFGTCDVSGLNVTFDSGDQFTVAAGGSDVSPGDYFMLPEGQLYTVASVAADGLSLVLALIGGGSPAPGPMSNVNFQLGTEFVTGAMVENIDGYFIVNVPNTNTFRISNFEDGTKWDELDFATKSGTTDNIAAVCNVYGNLGLVGDTNSTEIWSDSGNANFPFSRVSGATLAVGADAPWSVAKMLDGSIIMLGSGDQGNGIIIQSTGGAPSRISSYAMENAIRKYSRTDDAIASTYLESGHSYYRIDFPTANATWEFDQNMSIWVELGVETAQDEVYGCDLGRYHAHVTWGGALGTAAGETQMHLAFDYTSGKVWMVSPDYLDDDGVDFPVMRISPHLNSNLELTVLNAFALDCELGTIPPTVVGLDGKPLIPTVEMFYSLDGGRTWLEGGAASLGRAGEYQGTFLNDTEYVDTTANSQTGGQPFEAVPIWRNLGVFWVSGTIKIKSTGKMLRAVYNGLVEIGPVAQGKAA